MRVRAHDGPSLRRLGALSPDMEEGGFEEDACDGFVRCIPREVAMCYDAILICDVAGRLATSLAQLGLVVGPVMDLAVSPWYDLLDNGFL